MVNLKKIVETNIKSLVQKIKEKEREGGIKREMVSFVTSR